MPNYPDQYMNIDPAKKNYAAVKAAVDHVKQKSAYQYYISVLGGAMAVAAAITAVVILPQVTKVYQAMERITEHYKNYVKLSSAYADAVHAVVSRLKA